MRNKDLSIIIIFSLIGYPVDVNENEIDGELLNHAKFILDNDSIKSDYLKIIQFDYSDFWAYRIIGDENWVYYAGLEMIYPTDIVEHNNKYILLYLYKKKELSEKDIFNELEKTPNDTTLPSIYDNRSWFFLKCKASTKSAFAQVTKSTSFYEIDSLRHFSCTQEEQNIDPLIDMVVSSNGFNGKNGEKGIFEDLNGADMYIDIYNKGDIPLRIGFSSDQYGQIVMKNGEQSFRFVLKSTEAQMVAPNVYEIPRQSKELFRFEFINTPIVLKDTPYANYCRKIYSLLRDSLFYVPFKQNNTLEKESKLWNEKVKIIFPMKQIYTYYKKNKSYSYVGDSLLYEQDE